MYPTDRRYSKEHEWIQVSGDEATIGITDFAQRELGDVVYVELPEKGTRVRAGDVLGTIESVKAVSEIYAPVSGTVLASNASLDEHPEIVNTDPHEGGWYCRLRLDDATELDDLLDANGYEALIGRGPEPAGG
jgi:glycine cleavage system H protein